MKVINSRHQNIKFTFEKEHNNKIAFLDISIARVGNELQTSLFQKKTSSGVFLNFNSNLPSEYKKGLLHTLLYWVNSICSNYTNLYQKIDYLKSVSQKNSFPLLINDKQRKLCCSWSSSKFSIFQTNSLVSRKFFLKKKLYLNLDIRFCITWLILPSYKRITP